MTTKFLLFAAALTALTPGISLAQTGPCASDAHDDFDFWVGHWNVYAPDGGPYQGENRIEKTQGGCLITEHWTGASGSTGESMNYLDPFSGQWRQIWVSAGSIIDYSGGLDESGAMVLNGEIHSPASGVRSAFRGTWTERADGSVRQQFEIEGADDQWGVWFTGIYVRQDSDPRAEEAAAARGE
ncbi:hypothetical protein [Maricaulis sp.]|uniref:hypothetical protein n=1 Tax=Maricaulis sp. TaxID=1486257 RepID=UPI002627E109|nr:hypothetical protein [Maricaulis sp.]